MHYVDGLADKKSMPLWLYRKISIARSLHHQSIDRSIDRQIDLSINPIDLILSIGSFYGSID